MVRREEGRGGRKGSAESTFNFLENTFGLTAKIKALVGNEKPIIRILGVQ